MATYTPNLNLYKPDATDEYKDFREGFNDNMDKLDQGGGGGGSGDSVSWTQVQASGTKIAEININGTSQNVYSPSGGGGDDEVIEGMLKGRLGLDGLLIDDQGNYIKTDQDDLMKAHVIVLFDRME